AALAIPPVRADLLVVADVDRLLEFADQIGGGEGGLLHGDRIRRISAEVTVSPFTRREEGRVAGQVEDDVAFAGDAVAREVEPEALARGRKGCRRSEEHTSELQ